MLEPLSTSTPWLVLRELQSATELRDYFRVRQQVYVHNGFFPEAAAEELDIDPYDPYSRFVGAYDVRCQPARLIAGCRMILPHTGPHAATVRAMQALQERSHTFHVEHSHDFSGIRGLADQRGHLVVEFGRNVCLPEYRSLGVGISVVRAIYGVALLAGARWAIANCPPYLQKYYEGLGCLILEGKGLSRYGGLNTDVKPIALDLHQLVGSDRQAQQCAAQLFARGFVQLCGERDCLAQHRHMRVLPVDEPERDEWSPREARIPLVARRVLLQDDTLGGGLRSGAVLMPRTDGKLELLERMAAVGVESACLGLPGAGPRALEDSVRLLAHAQRLPIAPALAGRAEPHDVDAIAMAAASAGVRPEARLHMRLGESWKAAVERARQHELEVTLVLEDPGEYEPAALARLCRQISAAGVGRVGLGERTGQATPRGTRRLVTFVREQLGCPLDWRGSHQGGLGVANGLAALEAGADRVHVTALGIAGLPPLEQMLEVLHRLAGRRHPSFALDLYLRAVSDQCGLALPAERTYSPEAVAV